MNDPILFGIIGLLLVVIMIMASKWEEQKTRAFHAGVKYGEECGEILGRIERRNSMRTQSHG